MEGNDHHSNYENHRDGASQENRAHGGHTALSGLSVAANGLRFVPSEIQLTPNNEQTLTFEILDNAGNVVTDFEEVHDELIHLIVVRRDLTRFQHRHPTMDTDGTWSERLTLPDPGVYRAFVDVSVDGQPTTLGTDLFAAGQVEIDSRPGSTRQATADDYEVALRPNEIDAGDNTDLEFEIRREGERVSQLEPYLGALGHLVALREGDLAYLHIHPLDDDSESGMVTFRARFPTLGRYRLFFQARPEGELITTSFDLHIEW